MRQYIYDSWNVVMDHNKNPLSSINNIAVRHMIMQVLAWMWVITFTIASGTWAYIGINAIVHSVLLGAVVITVATFETAKRKPEFFNGNGRGRGGEHE